MVNEFTELMVKKSTEWAVNESTELMVNEHRKRDRMVHDLTAYKLIRQGAMPGAARNGRDMILAVLPGVHTARRRLHTYAENYHFIWWLSSNTRRGYRQVRIWLVRTWYSIVEIFYIAYLS